MANSSIIKRLPKWYCRTIQRKLKNITSKLHRTAGSIGFLKKALHHEVTAKFAQVKGNFINVDDRYKSEKCIPLSHLSDHVRSNRLLIKKYYYLLNTLKQERGTLLIKQFYNIFQHCNKKKE